MKLYEWEIFFTCKILYSKFHLINQRINLSEQVLLEVIEETKKRGLDLCNNLAQEALDYHNTYKLALTLQPNLIKPTKDEERLMEQKIFDFIINLENYAS